MLNCSAIVVRVRSYLVVRIILVTRNRKQCACFAEGGAEHPLVREEPDAVDQVARERHHHVGERQVEHEPVDREARRVARQFCRGQRIERQREPEHDEQHAALQHEAQVQLGHRLELALVRVWRSWRERQVSVVGSGEYGVGLLLLLLLVMQVLLVADRRGRGRCTFSRAERVCRQWRACESMVSSGERRGSRPDELGI